MKQTKRFFSDEYVQDFLQKGTLPTIHNDIGYLLDCYLKSQDICLDIGTCTGLLAIRALRAGAKKVIGVDINENYIQKAVKYPNIEYICLAINKKNLPVLSDIIVKHNINTVIARRVFPEIAEFDSVGTIYELAKMFFNLGITKIFLEGRIPNTKAKNHFATAEKEIEAFAKYFSVKSQKNNAYLLIRNEKL